MRVVVSDANVLIDLIELGLTSSFFALEFKFLTSSLVYEELINGQAELLRPYVEKRILELESFSAYQMLEILEIRDSKPALSLQDSSAIFLAENEGATLLSSDKVLRKYANRRKVEVHGHLWVFDKMVEQKSISATEALTKLTDLIEKVNPKLGLPPLECKLRLEQWKNP